MKTPTAPMILHIGNYNYSSWSLRAWLVLSKSELPFKERMVDLDVPGYKDVLAAISDAATVPVLAVNDEVIPDSLAIAEFAAKCVPNLWPKDEAMRERARDVTRLMHAGFQAIRDECPMNLRRRTNGPIPTAALQEAKTLDDLFQELLGAHNGPFLFDGWCIADAFYAPIATRFESYGLPRSRQTDTYFSELMSDPDYQEWEARAFAETHVLPGTDAVNA